VARRRLEKHTGRQTGLLDNPAEIEKHFSVASTMSEQDAKWNQIRARRNLSEREVYELVGCMLFRLHEFEKLVRVSFHLLQATFSRRDIQYDAAEFLWKMRRATCGQFFRELRKVMTVDPKFDRQLLRLVRRRNQFAHKLALRKEFSPETNAHWHENVARFIFRLEADVNTAWDVFARFAEMLIQQADGDPRQAVLKSNIAALKVLRPRSTVG